AGEVEQALLAHPSIQSAVVVGHDFEHGKELVAYLAPASGQTIPDVSALRSFLSESLPDYMIPSHFVELEALPLTTSGKVNRKALPAPNLSGLATGTAYVAPRNAIEKQLVEIWSDILGRDHIGIHDNFFHLGGHSLRAIRMLALVRQRLSAEVALREVFAHPTVAGLSQVVAGRDSVLLKAIEPVVEQPSYALSNAQRRLWVLSRLEEGLTAYNMPAAIRIKGALDVEALERAFEGLINRHEILRTRFVAEEDATPRQVVSSSAAFQLPCRDWREKGPAETEAYLQAHANFVFNLSEGPLLKAELLQTGEDNHLLLFNMHHIISDGWSIEVLLRELSALYDAAVKGRENPLPALKIQYKDYAAWQNELLSDNERLAELRAYWRAQLADLPVLELPTDYPRPTVKSYQGSRLRHTFGPEVLEQLEKLSRESGASLFMALTALVKVLLYRYTNQEDILVGTPTAGRNHPDLHDQLGFYVNTLALRGRLQGEEGFTQTLAQVKETALAAFERELYPFDRLVEELEVARDQSRNPVFDIMVALQNNERSALKLGDAELSPLPGKFEVSKFDLTFGFAAGAEGLQMDIEYSTDLFRRDRIERMAGHLETLLESILTNPAQPISQLNILPAAERDLLLNEFNDTQTEYPKDKTIIDLFEEQVER
ncbi:MAG: hypothetical protein KDD28_36005, partial [Phaeodactylibacter sp.]|nr:hypothetical protein [Phaeodactylibacter sp.]